MCLPLLAAGAAAGQLAGIGLQAYSANAAANYQQKTAENNAKIAGYMGSNAEREGEIRADQIKQNVAGTISAQRTNFAASGVSLGTGTSLLVEQDTARKGALDLANNAYNTDLKKWGFDVERANAKAEASAAGSAATNAWITGAVSGVSSLLGSASQYKK